jgi:hypothetical protein
MLAQLALKKTTSFENARNVYTDGGHSNSYAVLNLKVPLPFSIRQGTPVSGFADDNTSLVEGYTVGETAKGNKIIKVVYLISEIQDSYVPCQVGALPRISQATLAGCKIIHCYTVCFL